jgi:malonyl CoA-acyl carrier protein transacylase
MGVIDKRRKLMAREGKGELTNALGGEEAEIYRRISGKGVYLAISKSDGNISLGGYKTPLDLVCEELRAQGCVKKIIPNKKRLPAFHTPLFEEEADELLCSLREHSDIFLQSDRAVISNLDAQLFTGSVEDIIYRISRQMCRTVQFKRGQRSVEDRIEEIQVIGPGAKTMANIVKTNIPGMPVTTIETAESLDSYWTDRMRRLPSLTQY